MHVGVSLMARVSDVMEMILGGGKGDIGDDGICPTSAGDCGSHQRVDGEGAFET